MKTPAGYIIKREAAEVLGCEIRTVDNLMKRRRIPFYKFGKRVLFKRDELLASIEGSKVMAATEAPIANACRNECWDKVCSWLQVCAKSPDPKQRNLATETLRFITTFDV